MFKPVRLKFAIIVGIVLSAAAVWATLEKPVKVSYDQHQIPTIRAKNELDAIQMLGYMHAKDRFFQMDVQRRAFSGTLAELLGPAALPQDVQLRTLGLRRAAERSLAVQTPEVIAWLEAYSDGVNAWLQNEQRGTDDEDSCSKGGVSSDDSSDGHSLTSSDDDSDDSGDSGSGASAIFHDLPLEYAYLETSRESIAPWTPLDSLTMVKGLAFGLSFGLDDIDRTLALLNFLGVGDVLGFNGLQLFASDLYPTMPFDSTISITSAVDDGPGESPPVSGGEGPQAQQELAAKQGGVNGGGGGTYVLPEYLQDTNLPGLLQSYRDLAAESPMLLQALEQDYTAQGSNWFLASGANTASGFPMLANDPHLSLGTPSTFYEVHLEVKQGINAAGVSFPGAPGLVQGCTEVFCWGSTVNPLDVTDVYQEVLLPLGPDPSQPTHTYRADGPPEPLQFIPQTFLFNAIGDGVSDTLVDAMIPPSSGGVTLVVPRRNNGPIVQVSFDPGSPTPFTGISVHYTGWSATQELEAFRQFLRAESPDDFKEALQYFDVGSQNWAYADINGNIAYFTSAELPIREDLQNFPFVPAGLQPPYFIRDGTHTLKHDWQPLTNPQPHQALGTEILPFAEMPQIVNPASGVILNANNDPIGTSLDGVSWNEFRAGFNGRLYLSPGYAPGFRIGRIQQLVDEALAEGPLTVEKFKSIQANNQLLDAEVFVPFLLEAFDNAGSSPTAALAALAADPGIAEAIGRLAEWDFSTPTGIAAGFDPFEAPFSPPTQAEIDASVAATIYSVWRGQIVQRIVDGTLASMPIPLDAFAPPSSQAMVAVKRLLENYPVNGGVGQSLIDFFNEPGAGAGFYDERDLALLRSLENALNLLASDEFAPAFANSTVQDDYRWGNLHRIVLAHPMGGPFNIPPSGGPGNLSPELQGISRAGGMGAVDASSHSARADGLNEFMFGSGPARRFVGTMTPDGPVADEVLPGGESGHPGSPFQVDQLNLWLVNAYHPLPLSKSDTNALALTCQVYLPPQHGGSGTVVEGESLPTDGTGGGLRSLDSGGVETPRSDGRSRRLNR